MVGLLAFFLADALPGGPNAIATFFVATAAVLVLFLLTVAVAAVAGRVRRDAPRPFGPLPARARRRPRAGVRVDVGWGSAQAASPAAAADVEEVTTPAPPGSKRHFLQAVDELLAVVDALPESDGREIQDGLLRFATSADVTDLAELVERRRVPELRRFAMLAEQLPKSRLRYLAVVLRARKIVR
ncbi:hypothetical protein E1218_33505 [Kribbella turkmenica]|uniref:Uncharacterized protein n=1 Tax=Kribbella turkmenica TaxID=2530375 RepID=A0A4R4W671_9ACTN|nr:hypothetical protein [Kribbella turkmenica]TDD14149.1 hypothetical protein E1218_33505 [Kribbella turkmenica]